MVDTSIGARRLACELDILIALRGKPQRTGVTERYYRRLRDECPNEKVFASLAEACPVIER